MKRLDLLWGVLCLTLTLLSPIVLQIYGYLDVQTYDEITHDNTFYRKSIEPIRAYPYYRYFLLSIYMVLLFALIGLACEHKMRRVSRFQIQCYRPYYLYHCTVCLIPFAIRYANMTANMSDDIMIQVDWKQFFYVKTSILKFILSFSLSLVRNYKIWRLVLYVLITLISAVMLVSFFSVLWGYFVELLDNLKRSKGEFLTTWSHNNYEQFDELNISMENHHVKEFHLNQSLFLKTGQKEYRTALFSKRHSRDKENVTFPYHQRVLAISTGESLQLSCSAVWETNDPVNVLWFVNGSYLDSNIYDIEKNGYSVSSKLSIDFIEDIGFGNYYCFFRKYAFYGREISFASKIALSFLRSDEILIGQYNVREYIGKDFYVYAPPGGAVDLRWKILNFNEENQDVIQYYFVNGNLFEKPHKTTLTSGTCSTLSYLYIAYGSAMDWFIVPSLSSPSDILRNVLNMYETRFTECAGCNVYGVHTVEYFRRVYDEKSKAFVLREVKHPDTLYVLPDSPYFYKMDNATKEDKKAIIKQLQKSKLNYTWFENSYAYILLARVILELITVVCALIVLWKCLSKLQNLYKRFVIWPLKRKILGRPIYTDQCSFTENQTSYSCYIFCADADKDSVYNNIVRPLRYGNISTGFIFEECELNKCGKSIFDIQCDLFMRSEHLVFYVTSSYLEEIRFSDIYLEMVLGCIQRDVVPGNRVLFIVGDNCELPNKLQYCFPEASTNIHDWVVSTDFEARFQRILEWIKRKKETKTSEFVVSTIFVGLNVP